MTDALGDLDPGPLLVPQVDVDRLAGEFGEAAPLLRERFFTGPDDDFRFVHATQVELAEAIDAGGLDGIPEPERAGVNRRLLDLAADALLVRVDDGFQPRISWDATERYRRLSPTSSGGWTRWPRTSSIAATTASGRSTGGARSPR